MFTHNLGGGPEARRRFAAVFGLALLAAACGGGTTTTTVAPTTTAATTTAIGDLLEVASAQGDLGTFLSALDAAGIMDGLHGEGPFTVFVPTDQAFVDYLGSAGMTQDELFAEQAMVRGVLDHHIVSLSESAEQVMAMAGQSFTTAAGFELPVSVEGETVMVGNATVLRYDIQASNGVIHVIDSVLIPES